MKFSAGFEDALQNLFVQNNSERLWRIIIHSQKIVFMAQNSTCMLFEGIDKVNTLHDTASTFDLINYKSEKSILFTNTNLIQLHSAAS